MSAPSTNNDKRKPTEYRVRKVPEARFDHFLEARCRPTDDDTEWLSDVTLWAHYLRWAFLVERRTSVKSRFTAWLKKRKVATRSCNGHTLWAIALRDERHERQQRQDSDRERRKIVIGRVRILIDQPFVHKVMPAGLVLEWMTPSRGENRRLTELYEQQLKNKNTPNPVPWLVVVWEDKRRWIPADAIEKVE